MCISSKYIECMCFSSIYTSQEKKIQNYPSSSSSSSSLPVFFFHGDHNSLLSSTLISPPPSLPLLRPNPHANPMPLPRPSILVLRRHHRRFLFVAAAVRQDLTTWTSTLLSRVSPASGDSSLFHVAVDLSSVPDLAGAFTAAGQYVQIRIPLAEKPSFLVIMSTLEDAVKRGEFEFLVTRITGSTAEGICRMRSGDLVEIGGVIAKGFQIERVEGVETVLIFATGFGTQSECRIERLSAKELRRRIESEARVTEYFDESNEELDCAGVSAVRRTVSMVGCVLRRSLKRPHVWDSFGLLLLLLR